MSKTEMMMVVTQKLKQQSLDEIRPEGQKMETSSKQVDDSYADSGTESDEENAELEALENALTSREDQENFSSVCTSIRVITPQLSSHIKKPLQLSNRPASVLTGLASPRSELQSIYGDFERPSSEEELSKINCPAREKRTWSQANGCGSCEPDGSGSSDEEVRDLCIGSPNQPVLFSSSPPKGVHRYSKTLSPRVFLARVSPISAVSPRKRHRQNNPLENSSDTESVMQRPCIDFEKMQASGAEYILTAYPSLLMSASARFTPLCPVSLR